MSMRPTLSYLLPVHNQERVLDASVRRLVERLRRHPGSEVILVENGSTDSSLRVCTRLAAECDSAEVAVHAITSARGFGNAYRRGIALARADILVLTAADLPFGFDDLDAFLALEQRPAIAIGSKGHPDSRIQVAARRRVMSSAFRSLRRVVLGLRIADSQGTILIERVLAQRVLPRLRCADFLVSTEIVCWAHRAGHRAVELPVDYVARGESTVSPLRDSVRMASGLVQLRRRLAAA